MIRSVARPAGLVAVLSLLLIAVGGMAAARAGADPVIVPKDPDGNVVVKMTADAGGISGKLSVVNPAARSLTVEIKGRGAIAQCTFALGKLAPNSTTDVDVKSEKCTLGDNGESATVTFTGRRATPILVLLKPAEVTKPVSLGASTVAFVLAAIGTALLLLALWALRPATGTDRVGLRDQLPSAPDGWSFKDSWATNVGAVATVFVGIFGTNDVVKALVGVESDSLPGRLLIIAAISALLIGVAPLVLKAIGPEGTATVLGLLVAAWLTTTAVAGQVLAVYTAFGVDDPSGAAWGDFFAGFAWDFPLLVAVLLLLLLGAYAYRTLAVLLVPGQDPPPTPWDDLLVASATLVAAQVCCDREGARDVSGGLLEAAHVQAVNYLLTLRRNTLAAAKDAPAAAGKRMRVTARRQAGTARGADAALARTAAPSFENLDDVLRAAASAGPARSALL